MQLSWPGGPLSGTAQLPASKSEANRALILQALAGGGTVDNLSDANDTQLMQRLLLESRNTNVLNAEDAGTVMRFLTAYLAVTDWKGTVTGTARMKERPIGILVDALRQLGAQIEYLGKEGFPPLHFAGFLMPTQISRLNVRADVSSQFISALLMVGPYLQSGLRLRLVGAIGSWPYIQLTLSLMRRFGAIYEEEKDQTFNIGLVSYRPASYTIESDWSAASYWYSLVALGPVGSEVTLPALRQKSLQGDQAIAEIMTYFGVATTFLPDAVHLKQQPLAPQTEIQTIDFTDCPDLAQTVAVIAAALNRPVDMTGLESLRIKETDRIAALQTELAKFGGDLREVGESRFRAESTNFAVNNQSVATYHDHRMAMAFGPLAMRGPLTIESPTVVRKSYPQFWKELAKSGFVISEVD